MVENYRDNCIYDHAITARSNFNIAQHYMQDPWLELYTVPPLPPPTDLLNYSSSLPPPPNGLIEYFLLPSQQYYSTISEAISETEDEDTRIIVHPGVYNETIELDRPVTIIGAGMM